MAKNEKKSPAAKAAEQAAAQQTPNNKKDQKPVEVIQTGELMQTLQKGGSKGTSLSPDATVMALNGLKSMVHDNPNAAEYYGMTEDAVKNINKFTLAGFATVLAIEVEEKKSKFAIKMLEKQPEAINAISEITGVNINTKLLPAPNKEGVVEVPAAAIEVSDETKKKIKKEKEIAAQAVNDPTKVTDDEILKASLVAILSDIKKPRPYDRIDTAISFYLSVLEFRASNAENKDEELAKVESISRADALRQIAEIAGPNVYSLDGICKLLRQTLVQTGSPVSTFCLFRNASINPKNGVFVDDNLVADIVKTLIQWSSSAGIAAEERKIAESERIQKKNADNKGIVNSEKEKIEKYNENIEYFKKAVELITNPSMDLADKFLEAYDDDKNELYATARRAGKNIIDSYYKKVNTSEVDQDALKKNLQQHCGIILNMFRDPLSESIAYKTANLIDLSTKPAEGDVKN